VIRTITLNTGFDETVTVSSLPFGGVADLLCRESLPSGKGINAGRVVRALGAEVVVYGLIGKSDHQPFRDSLWRQGVESRMVEVDAPTRCNLTLVVKDLDQPAAHFRAPGFSLRDETPVRKLRAQLRADTRPGDIVSLHGSTPEGLPDTTWTEFAQVALQQGALVLVDIYGPALAKLIATVGATCCKPNEHEIAGLPVCPGNDRIDAARAALRFMRRNAVQLPLVTMGAEGLMFALGDELWRAQLAPSAARISVGAGDACAAGMLVALQEGAEPAVETVRASIAAAVAHVESTPLEQFAARARHLRERVQISAAGRI
jgi:1-phosphofructokinase family hexose kinase